MGYLKIPNLYKDQRILMMRRCISAEKVDGTSCHISWKDNQLRFFAGGCNHESFVAIFNQEELAAKFMEKFAGMEVTVFGEGYGGKMQGMSKTYGPKLKFIAFEVKIGDSWLDIPKAENVAVSLGLDFVPYREISTDLAEIDAERDRDSEIAIRNGMGTGHIREGVVLFPLVQLRLNNGERVIAKHKRDEFRETKTPRPVDAEKLKTLVEAEAIADEWVTPMRLNHVLQKIPDHSLEKMRDIIAGMVNDILIEGKGEIVDSSAARKLISQKTAILYKREYCQIKQ